MNKSLLTFVLFASLLYSQLGLTGGAGDRIGNGGSGDEQAVAIATRELNTVANRLIVFFERYELELLHIFPQGLLSNIIFNKGSVLFQVTDQETLFANSSSRPDCIYTSLTLPTIITCRLESIRLQQSSPRHFFAFVFQKLISLTDNFNTPEEFNRHYSRISSRITPYVARTIGYELEFHNGHIDSISGCNIFIRRRRSIDSNFTELPARFQRRIINTLEDSEHNYIVVDDLSQAHLILEITSRLGVGQIGANGVALDGHDTSFKILNSNNQLLFRETRSQINTMVRPYIRRNFALRELVRLIPTCEQIRR